MASGTEGMPLTQLQTSSGTVFVTGPLEPELRALSGATVDVIGEQTRRDDRVSVEVQRYDVVEINGERPVIGRWLANHTLLVGSDTLNVTGVLDAPIGAKIWIAGDRSARQVSVRSYGIIVR
jgi:hypothetical protein